MDLQSTPLPFWHHHGLIVIPVLILYTLNIIHLFLFFAGVDDSNRCNGKLFSVVPVNKREGDKWFNLQKKHIQQASGSSGEEHC